MRSRKFVGVELKSVPQLLVLILFGPAIMSYLVWSKLNNVIVSTGSSIIQPL